MLTVDAFAGAGVADATANCRQHAANAAIEILNNFIIGNFSTLI